MNLVVNWEGISEWCNFKIRVWKKTWTLQHRILTYENFRHFGTLTFFITKCELSMTGRSLNPFWNWERCIYRIIGFALPTKMEIEPKNMISRTQNPWLHSRFYEEGCYSLTHASGFQSDKISLFKHSHKCHASSFLSVMSSVILQR